MASVAPVARVLVDVPLAHLDRAFDYLVPDTMAASAVPGARVKVRFAGRIIAGFVIERADHSDHPSRLTPLRSVVSEEPVLSPAVAGLTRAVAARYAGTTSDVLRLAVPRRAAAVEKRPPLPPAPAATVDLVAAAGVWEPYEGGPGLVRELATGQAPRAVWSALPGADWPAAFAALAAATYSSGRGVLLCLPDGRDVARLDAALTEVLGSGRHVVLSADLGPAARYTAFLAVSRGAVRVVIGTRAAAFAPVHRLGLVGIWDDGDDIHAEQRAPYPHTREVLLLRAHREGCAAVLGGFARTAEAQRLTTTGWAKPVQAPREEVRRAGPWLTVTGASDVELARDAFARSARLPREAFEVIRAAVAQGPVLVQTPRTGYAAGLACGTCRAAARCPTCTGPLRITDKSRPPECRWCGQQQPAWRCPRCSGGQLRAPVIGERRTAEELGRAFPLVVVRTSSADTVLTRVDPVPSIVVATPGAEPMVDGGYAAVVLLDTWLMLARADLRTNEESLRRWMNAAALARPATAGGRVVAVGDPAEPALQALVRWDPAGFAARELADRKSAHLTPAARLAVLTGDEKALPEALASLELPPRAEVLGPVLRGPASASRAPAGSPELDERSQAVVRVPAAEGVALSRALLVMQAARSAKKLPLVRVQVDPVNLG